MECEFRFRMLSVCPTVVCVKVSSVDSVHVINPAFVNKSFSLLISLSKRSFYKQIDRLG